MARPVLFLCLFLLATPLAAQVPTFKKSYGGSGDEQAHWLEVLPDGAFVVCGHTTTQSNGGQDALVVKFDPDGNLEWANTIGGAGHDYFYVIKSTTDGGFIATGTTAVSGGNVDLLAVKLDAGGNIVWQKHFGGSNTIEEGFGLSELSDGYLFCGDSRSVGNQDCYFVKTDTDGNLVWAKIADEGIAAESVQSGNEILVASYFHDDGAIIRLNNNGNVLGVLRLAGAGSDILSYLKSTGNGFIASESSWTPAGNTEQRPWLVKLNSSGAVEWSKSYNVGGYGRAHAEVTSTGAFVFSVRSQNLQQAIMVKTDAAGDVEWAKLHTYPTAGAGQLRHLKEAPDGGFIAIGYCTIAGRGQELIVFKTDASGNIEGCCPTDHPVTAQVFSPTQSNPGLPLADLTTHNSPAFSADGVAFNESEHCNGPSCCPTDAGTMQNQTTHACVNETAALPHNGDEVLDNDDLLQFILFSDLTDTLGSIIAISNTPTFTFNPATMQTGVTYYVAAIAGNNVGGNVDFNDTCFDISNAVQLIWHPLPEVELQTDNSDVCAGNCRTITATLTGTPSFTMTLSSPAGTTTVTIQNNTGTFEICLPPGTPPGSFTVQATALTDAYCTCP